MWYFTRIKYTVEHKWTGNWVNVIGRCLLVWGRREDDLARVVVVLVDQRQTLSLSQYDEPLGFPSSPLPHATGKRHGKEENQDARRSLTLQKSETTILSVFFPFLNQITIQDFVWFSVRLFHSYRYSVTEDYVQKTSLRLLLTRDPVNSGWKFPRWRWPWKCWRKKPASCSTRLRKGRLRSHGSLGSVKRRTQNLK